MAIRIIGEIITRDRWMTLRLKKKSELNGLHKAIMQDWQRYDEQYPVIRSALAPTNLQTIKRRKKSFLGVNLQ